VHGFTEHAFEVEYRPYELNLQRGSSTPGTQTTGVHCVSTADAKRRLNAGNLAQALGAQPYTRLATTNTTRRENEIEKLTAKTTPVKTNHIN